MAAFVKMQNAGDEQQPLGAMIGAGQWVDEASKPQSAPGHQG
jgi:hypothetical protein